MTIKAWPDIQRGTGEVVENLKIFGQGEENVWGYGFSQLKTVFPFGWRVMKDSEW